jgi:glycosyltransferase involved in cell wall biosynthesis
VEIRTDHVGEKKQLTIVIPALNEEQGIAETVRAIPIEQIGRMGYNSQVLVVDNGSNDRTAELATGAGADVVIEPIRGYGSALRKGFSAASGNVIVTADADATYPVETIPVLLETFERDRLDFLTTNRFLSLDKAAMSPQNRLGNAVLALETRLLFGMNMKDPESGMWMFRKDILDRLKLHSNSWPLSHEIKIEACYYGKCRWKEVAIRYRVRLGKTKLHNGWRVGFADLLHIAKKRVVR